MILSADKITKMLKEVWPGLSQIWLFDQEYFCLTKQEYEEMVKDFNVAFDISGEIADCDELALFMHASVKRKWAEESGKSVQLAFGEVAGRKFNGWADLHSQNIAVTQDNGIILIEPKIKDIWKANPVDDDPYWVRM